MWSWMSHKVDMRDGIVVIMVKGSVVGSPGGCGD